MSNIVRNVLAAIAAVVLTAWLGAAVGTSVAGAQLDRPALSAYHGGLTTDAARKG
jgi:hypothetical protein